MARIPVGAIAFAVGCALAVAGLGLYQAWWTIVFPIGGFVAYAIGRDGAAPGRTIALGAGVAGALALGGMGLFLVVMSPFSCAQAPCPEGVPPLLLVGIAALAGSVAALGFIARTARRRTVR
ncbi:MAG TPA: hypothetical protein VJ850_00210 [Candidatus Limnocylindrales bacterium]|nr:hypothetical protein [Candidatus Limnocylindrales bacterium]